MSCDDNHHHRRRDIMKIDRFCKCLFRLSIFIIQILPGNDGGDEVRSKPVVLLVGPWSTGKTTFLNYLLDISDEIDHLDTGVNLTTNNFVIVSHGPKLRVLDGRMLMSSTDQQPPQNDFDQFGSKFLEHLYKIEMPETLLQNLTFVDTPGFMEHKKLPERGYPFKDAIKYWAGRADLILVIFDTTKLDVGSEMDALFSCLKGKESMVRIILNKADSVKERELMRVYGSLLWSLAPLFNVTEPPRVYVGSFWSQKPYSSDELGKMLLQEEKELLSDLRQTMTKQLFTKISRMEMQASMVNEHCKILIERKKDDRSIYEKFFAENSIANFKIDDLKIAQKAVQEAIFEDLPLLKQILSKIITLDEDDLDLESLKILESPTGNDLDEEGSFSELFEHNLGRGYTNPGEIPDQVRRMIEKNKRISKNRKQRKSAKGREEEKEDVQRENVLISKNDLLKEEESMTIKCRPYRKTCIEIEHPTTKSEFSKKCIIYRKSCKVQKIQVEKFAEQRKVAIQTPKVEPVVQNLDPKRPPYRKKCESDSQESIKDKISPQMEVCPPYRKSCSVEIPKLEKFKEPSKKMTVVVEEPKSKCPLYRKRCDLDKVEGLLIEIPKSTKCPKYRISCADIDSGDESAKSYRQDTSSEEKLKSKYEENFKREKSAENLEKAKSVGKPTKPESEEKSTKPESSKKPKSGEKFETANLIKPKSVEKSKKSKESTSEEDQSSGRRIIDSDENPKEGDFLEDIEDKQHLRNSGDRKKDSSKDKKESTRLLTKEIKELKRRKCPPYRKKCEADSQESIKEKISPQIEVCPPYRKSCSVKIPKLEKVKEPPEKATIVVEAPKSKRPLYRKRRDYDRAEGLLIEIPKSTKCPKYRISCADINIGDESIKFNRQDTFSEEKSKPNSEENFKKAKSVGKSRKPQSEEKSEKPKSENRFETGKFMQPKAEGKSKKSEESTSEEDQSSGRRIIDSDENPKEGDFLEDIEDKQHLRNSGDRKKDSSKDKKESTRLLTKEQKPQKCPPYRKKCEANSQESVEEQILPKIEMCPPYRKSCSVEIPELEKVVNPPEETTKETTFVLGAPKSKCSLYRKRCDLDKVEDLLIEIPKCPKYRKSCADIDIEDESAKSNPQDIFSDEKLKKPKSGEKSKKPKSEEKFEIGKSKKQKLMKPKSEESTSGEDETFRGRILDSDENSKEGVFVEDVEDNQHLRNSKDRKKDSSKDKKKSTRILTEEIKEEQKQRKCPPYRKSCDSTIILQTGETFTSWTNLLSKVVFGKTPIKARKCILYRKSCSDVPKQREGKISVPKSDQIFNKKTATPDEIKRQKESIAPSDRSEETILEKSYPTESEKCLNYRKSCQEPKLRTNEQWNVEKTTEKLLQYTRKKKPAQKKCPVYRKSCESFPKMATFDKTSSEEKLGKQNDGDETEKIIKKCPIYRKSCAKYEKHSDPQTEKSRNEGRRAAGGDDENFIYVLDKKTGKTTKYCKKNATKSKQ